MAATYGESNLPMPVYGDLIINAGEVYSSGILSTTNKLVTATNPLSTDAPDIPPPDPTTGAAGDLLSYLAGADNPLSYTVGEENLDPCATEPCLSCPGKGGSGGTVDGSDNCVCDCAFLPSMEVLLGVVRDIRAIIARSTDDGVTRSTIITKYTAQARMNDYTRARFIWIDMHPKTVFDLTNLAHRYSLRDIYLAYGLSGMELDPAVNTLG